MQGCRGYPPAARCRLKGRSKGAALAFFGDRHENESPCRWLQPVLRSPQGDTLRWHDPVKLTAILLPRECTIDRLRYFTARVSGKLDPQARQHLYLKALATLPEVEIHYGRFLAKTAWRPPRQLKRFAPGDVLFGKLRPYLAKVTRPTTGDLCVGEFLVLRPRDNTTFGGTTSLDRAAVAATASACDCGAAARDPASVSSHGRSLAGRPDAVSRCRCSRTAMKSMSSL